MLDIGWTEMLVIAVVAVVVIGPKELPKALRTAGQWMRKARGLAREFQNSIDDMVRESELEELRKQANQIHSFNPERLLDDADPTGGKPKAGDTPNEPPAASAQVAPPHSLGEEHGKPAAPAEGGADPARQSGG